jgi:DNA (cytosine-5)-methyltransferase 1
VGIEGPQVGGRSKKGSEAGRRVGVKLVRGPFVELPPHPDSIENPRKLASLAKRFREQGALLAADLFAGAGGISLGLEEAGFRVVYGVDHSREALETHRHLFPGLTVDADLGDPEVIESTSRLLKRIRVDLIAGGPPCQPFSRAGRSLMEQLVLAGRRPRKDERRELWRSFLEIVRRVRPRAVLMENVPEMALERDMLILRLMVHELEEMGYGVETRVVDTWRYGVPQFRQRLILVALRDGLAFHWPAEVSQRVRLRDAISDLPPVEGGWRPEGGAEGYTDYDGPRTSFQKRMRRDVPPVAEERLYDHITRPVREDDAKAFAAMDSSTRYSDLPEELKRYRDDIFDDKYKRLDNDDLSRTITAHIAKDGYWYIHPEQDRTITIREAARIQTFPDHVRFAGPPSAAFRQIGNAVPPALSGHLGRAIITSLEERQYPASTTDGLRNLLADWLAGRHAAGEIGTPWYGIAVPDLLAGRTPSPNLRWLVLVSEMLFDRVGLDSGFRRRIWPHVEDVLGSPETTVREKVLLRQIAHGVRREKRVGEILEAASHVALEPSDLETAAGLARIPGVGTTLAATVARICPGPNDDSIHVNDGLLRVVARHGDSDVDRRNKNSWGRLALARMVGVDSGNRAGKRLDAALAHLALFELASHVCRSERPVCEACPLAVSCASRRKFTEPTRGQLRMMAG